MSEAFLLEVDREGIAHLVFNLPGEKVNKLSTQTIQELEEVLNKAANNKEIKALAISSGKEDLFIAGADLHGFQPIFNNPALAEQLIKKGHHVFNKLGEMPFPTIALINGACLGGGMELALACTYRVVSDHVKTLLGLPEVTLGIIPGWGGTQRLPRLVGLVEGLPLVLSGRPIKAYKAWKIGLADAIVPKEFFENKSKEFIHHILTDAGKKQVVEKRKKKGWLSIFLEKNPLGRALLFHRAKQDVLKKTKGHYPAPLVALNLIQETYTLPLNEGLAKEIETFTTNIPTAFIHAPNLIHLFFIQEAMKKEKGVENDVKPSQVSSVGVIGAGTMGGAIAWLFSNQDISVRVKDIDWAAVGKGYGAAYGIYSKLVKEKKLKPSEASLKFHKLSGTIDYSGFNHVDLVIEAAVENLELKHKILIELEEVIGPDVIIGSNTSSLSIGKMNKVMKHPERLIGIHFFNPPNRMPLVEIVASDQTSSQAIATAVDLCKKLGKTPVVVRDCPGFLVNRIFVPGANEVMLMYDEGVNFERLEKMMLDFGMPMSPFVLGDEIGNDVTYKVSKVLHDAYGERMVVPKLLEAMNEHKFLGKKTGKGFYLYQGDKRKGRNSEVEKLRSQKTNSQISDEDLRNRPMLAMINEASRCLSEKIISNPAYLDMALIMGIGFPPFRGGLLRYADKLGIDYIVPQLKRFQGLFGGRFAPSELLLDMQKNKKTFF